MQEHSPFISVVAERAETKVTAMADETIDENDIDYLHPDGKPEQNKDTGKEVKKSIEEQLEDVRTVQQSIDEADGHHVCSSKCQTHHKVQTENAQKTA